MVTPRLSVEVPDEEGRMEMTSKARGAVAGVTFGGVVAADWARLYRPIAGEEISITRRL
jgi:hypothetical protein